MKPKSLLKIAETLRGSHHHHLGIAQHPPSPPHAPAAVRLERGDIQSFASALGDAREQWPDADLCLIGADGTLGTTNIDDPLDTLPLGFLQFLDPEPLLRIPVGDPEDQGDQIDYSTRLQAGQRPTANKTFAVPSRSWAKPPA